MSKISIALCTYNGEKYLREQLESILRQVRIPDELIVSDDVSTDETAKIITDFAKVAPFSVSLEINNKNLGSTKNFERAISRCSGDIIFLCDQDDIWEAEKIAKIESIFELDEQIGMVFSNAELIDANSLPLGKDLWDFSFPKSQRHEEKMFEVLLWQNVVTGATTAFRAKFRDEFVPIPTDVPNLIHDAWIALVIAARAKVRFVEANLVKYRQHSDQQLGILSKGRTNRELFETALTFFQNEIRRLEKMRGILREFPGFQIPEIQKLAAELTGRYLEERRESMKHLETRMKLPRKKSDRVVAVWREYQSGRYNRFSKNWISALKDIAGNW